MDKIVSVIFFVSIAVVGPCLASTSDCKFKSSAGSFDFSPLKKSYTFNQTVINTAQNLLTNPGYSETANLTFTVGICQNADTSSECKGPGAVFMYDKSTKKCTVLGSMNASVFEVNPFQDGAYIDYYNGDAIDHITRYEARVYLVCDKTTSIKGPDFEHLKDSNQAHFHVSTKYACQ